MVTRIKINENPYVNIFQLIYILCVVEFHVAMAAIKLYDQEHKKWNIRNLFWYSIISIPSVAIIGIIVAAAIKIILI